MIQLQHLSLLVTWPRVKIRERANWQCSYQAHWLHASCDERYHGSSDRSYPDHGPNHETWKINNNVKDAGYWKQSKVSGRETPEMEVKECSSNSLSSPRICASINFFSSAYFASSTVHKCESNNILSSRLPHMQTYIAKHTRKGSQLQQFNSPDRLANSTSTGPLMWCSAGADAWTAEENRTAWTGSRFPPALGSRRTGLGRCEDGQAQRALSDTVDTAKEKNGTHEISDRRKIKCRNIKNTCRAS